MIKIIPVSIRRSTEHEPCTAKLPAGAEKQFSIKLKFFEIHLDYIYSKPSDFSLMCMTRCKQYNLKAICFCKWIKVSHRGAQNYLRKLYHSPFDRWNTRPTWLWALSLRAKENLLAIYQTRRIFNKQFRKWLADMRYVRAAIWGDYLGGRLQCGRFICWIISWGHSHHGRRPELATDVSPSMIIPPLTADGRVKTGWLNRDYERF